VQLTRRASIVIAVVLLALVAAGALYMRYRVDKAVAECDSPAPPGKPATPPPNLPGFQTAEACGPATTSTGKKP
jgi:hypothetical protein